MELNINFNKKISPLVNSSESLSNWFEKNQEMMAYFEMTHPGCLHFENTNAKLWCLKFLVEWQMDTLTWLEIYLPYSNEEKVRNAEMSIASIYDLEKDHLSDIAKEKYFIDVDG